MFSAIWAISNQAAGTLLGQAAPILYGLPAGAITDVIPTNGPDNVMASPTSSTQPMSLTSAELAAPLQETTEYIGTLYNGTSTRWYVLSFGTDSSLTTGPGWDNVTGLARRTALTSSRPLLLLPPRSRGAGKLKRRAKKRRTQQAGAIPACFFFAPAARVSSRLRSAACVGEVRKRCVESSRSAGIPAFIFLPARAPLRASLRRPYYQARVAQSAPADPADRRAQ